MSVTVAAAVEAASPPLLPLPPLPPPVVVDVTAPAIGVPSELTGAFPSS